MFANGSRAKAGATSMRFGTGFGLIGLAFVALLATAGSAPAQTTSNVGSTSQRNGFPSGGNAAALPTLAPSSSASATPTSGTTTSTTTTTSSTTSTTGSTGTSSTGATTGSGSRSASGGAGGGAAASGGGSGRSSAATAGTSAAGTISFGSTNWVLCPPPGASGIQPFLDGTGLSCAP